jgi:hypothetical protein
MAMRSKNHERLTLHISKELVDKAVAQDPQACTLACAGNNAGIQGVAFSYDLTRGEVCVAWDEIEPETGRMRHHTAVAEPLKLANQILTYKALLARLIPDEGWEVDLVNHESRYKQETKTKGKPRDWAAERAAGPKRKPRRTSSRMMRISGVSSQVKDLAHGYAWKPSVRVGWVRARTVSHNDAITMRAV